MWEHCCRRRLWFAGCGQRQRVSQMRPSAGTVVSPDPLVWMLLPPHRRAAVVAMLAASAGLWFKDAQLLSLNWLTARRAPGWHPSASHSRVRVEKRIALARLFFSTDRFATVIPVRPASSVSVMPRSASSLSI